MFYRLAGAPTLVQERIPYVALIGGSHFMGRGSVEMPMSDPNKQASRDEGDKLSPDDGYEEMEVLEPYMAGELASRFEGTKLRIQGLLDRLSDIGKIRKKVFGHEQVNWVRDAPIHECSECGYKYEVKFLHPVLSTVRFCPQCGTQL